VLPNAAVWLVILAAVVGANLPFLTQRLLLVWRPPGHKTLAMRLLELLVYYFAVVGLGLVLERNIGRIAPQGWEFYAITAALFLTLAFPGFVWRYLLKHRS
jgi:hypothetical protein